jgi:hypothetical protein
MVSTTAAGGGVVTISPEQPANPIGSAKTPKRNSLLNVFMASFFKNLVALLVARFLIF